ncbi:HAD family hydrolase [Clostridium sp. 'White wine YQ']|uniref:HAD family hydrolase n=1 Tax=Clostridium sp. 'White wine YQ' TaxID=3027474 RepID=UPI00236561D7|nr:HAD family phosphatase [Clostridium sp. 'White wine YQ']MDD7794844.1 HAD family phosphatase [Clostridium sp. 'White wine YQ']
MKKLELVIFDMDGLMFDTGQLAYRAYLESAKDFDFTVNHSVYYYLTGRKEREIREGMKELYGEDAPVSEWRDKINLNREKILSDEKRVYKKKGLLELLEFLKKNHYKIALASSTCREKIEYYFKIEDMPEVFDIIVAGDEVLTGKPNPEIFLKACEKANVAPERALVLEDSVAGIKAALKGNITPFLIPDDISNIQTHKGKHSLLKNPEEFLITKPENVEIFKDLLEVRDYLEQYFMRD